MGHMRYLVEKAKIAQNIHVLRQRVGNKQIYAVLKSNGYGLGCAEFAAVCAEYGLHCFAVTDVREAVALVNAELDVEELLLMSSAPAERIPELVGMGVTFTVASEEDAANLAAYPVRAHIKVDTGMGRRGFAAHQAEQIAQLYEKYPNIRFTGIYTHFSNGMDPKASRQQYERFRKILSELEKRGIKPQMRHCCNSLATFYQKGMMLDGVRIGSALLGRIVGGNRFGLHRTGVCQVPVETIKTVEKGTSVGYGSIFHAKKQMQIALCPIGTHHGFGVATRNGDQDLLPAFLGMLRLVRNRWTGRSVPSAQIGGKTCKAVGCLCSEAAMLDVTGVSCKAGDLAQFDINPMLVHDVPIEFV